jgi:hypothetical protein
MELLYHTREWETYIMSKRPKDSDRQEDLTSGGSAGGEQVEPELSKEYAQ